MKKLICPFDSKRLNVGAGYQSLADNIKKFHALRLMPEGINVCIENLDEGSGIAQSFIDHKACWHKSCNLKLNRTKLNRAEKRTSRESIDEATTSKKKTRHSFSVQSTSNPSVCFFCNENGQEALHESSTFGQDTRVRECAVKLNDTLLLAKLSAGDLIAQEAKYHSKCLVSLYNRASRIEMKNDNVESKKERQIHGIAFSELVSYINETRSCDETISVYKLSDLCKLYTERITCLGADVSSRVNSSRLKDRIVSNFPDLDAYKQGRENILAFKDDIGPALKRVCLEDFDNEFVNISKAATFVRKDIFASNSEFKGTFPKGCQEASVPQSLLSLIKDAQGVVQALDQSETMLKCQSKRVSLLPESYSNLPPAVLRFNEPDIPLVEGELSIDMFSFPAALKGEFKWLKHVAENSSVRATVGTNISWSAYHAAVLPDGNKLPAVSALLPLFHEQAKSVAMIRHSLNIIRSAASHVTKTRRAHQVTACTLYRLLSNAYCQYKDVLRDDEVTLEFEDWCLERSKESPHFKFWYTTLRFELTVLIFIRSIQSFRNDIVSLYDVIDDLGNPFLETSKDLLVLDSKNIVDISVVKTVNTIESLGQEQFEKYTKERLVDRTTSVFDTIKRNKLPLFQTPPPAKKTSTTDHKLMALKSNCSLFSRLYIACQSRDGNLDDFFRHENHAFPPSLSQNGTIRLGTKADLLSKCLERLTPPTDVKPVVSSVILDGSAVVNMLKPVNIKSFNEYALKVFIPYIQNIGKDVQRIDIVFDTYIDNSLKASTRGKRGKGIRRRVQDETNVPGNWQEFLRLDENKIELFHFLADKITSAGIDNEIVVTDKINALGNTAEHSYELLSPLNLTPFGTASQSSFYNTREGYPENAVKPPISNEFSQTKCTHTQDSTSNTDPAWWMFNISFGTAYITDILIYYRNEFAHRMSGFKLYVTNTSTIPPDGHLCYADSGNVTDFPDITQSIPCYQLGQYVIYYDSTGDGDKGPIVELCYVAINGIV
ncbi:unnamed protein product [Mytilus edulis]|uniref:Fucolectin tachylectin-4 pentraxin-1 domain-containing protein n=1 Tax=Mytilus edulis TaxID=6550 RepID=A0A8S3UKL9_MYTED|nr:unnamed protein product [Mytilus edulis]